MKGIREEALETFDKSASRYDQGVYQKKRLEMYAKLNIQLGVYFVGQINNLHKNAVIMFDENLQKQLKTTACNFAHVVSTCLKQANEYFINGAKGKQDSKFRIHIRLTFLYILATMLPETDWSYSHEQELLTEDFNEISSKARTTEFKKMNKALEKQIETELADIIALELNQPTNDMWHKVIGTYKSTVSDGKKLLSKKAKSKSWYIMNTEIYNTNIIYDIGFDSSKEEIEKSVSDLKKRTWIVLRKKVDEELADNLLLLKLRNRYICVLKYIKIGIDIFIDSRKNSVMMKMDFPRSGNLRTILTHDLKRLETR